jgi:hypothetical protein
MGVPIDTDRPTIICGQTPEVLVDRRTGERRTDREGRPLWRVWLVLLGEDEPKTMNVRTPVEPKGLVKGQPVRVAGLVASSWTNPEGRVQELFDASSIEPMRAQKDTP